MKSQVVFKNCLLYFSYCILILPQIVLGQTSYSNTNSFAIADNAYANSTIVVSDTFSVLRLTVSVTITHSMVGQLTLRLRKGTTEVILISGICGTNNDIAATFDDTSANAPTCSSNPALGGTMRTTSSTLSAFDLIAANGNWILSVFDNGGGITGTLSSFGLTLFPSLTTSPLTTEDLTTAPVTTDSITSGDLTTSPVTSSPLTTSPLTTSPLTSGDISTGAITTSPVTSAPITSGDITTSPLTTDPLTTSPLTTSPLTTSPATSGQITTSPLTSGQITTSPLTTSPLTTDPLTTSPLTTSSITTSPATSGQITTSPLTSSPLTTNPLTTSPVSTGAISTAPLTSGSVTTGAITTRTVTTGAITTRTVTTGAITTRGITTRGISTGPLTTSPLTTNPLSTSPVTTSPLTTRSVTSSPLTTSPLTTSPLTTSPVTSSPLTTNPVTSGDVTTSPLTTSPLTTSPLTSGDVTTSPLTTSPITSNVLSTSFVPLQQDDSAQTTEGEVEKGNGGAAGAAGAAAGVIVSLLVISALIVGFLLYRRRKQKASEANNSIELGKRHSSISEYASGPLQDLENVLLAYPKFGPIKAIAATTQVTEADKLANDFVNIFEVHGKTVDLIKIFIATEVKLANHAGSLMRANSMASKVMKSFSFLVGKDFLKKVLTKNIQDVMDKPSEDGASCEVDPDKLKNGEDVLKNKERLQKVCSYFLRSIFDSVDVTPLEFHEICKTLQEKVAAKFPESAQTCIGGFLFLRFFCPAICTPNSPIFGIVKSAPSGDASRALTLIAKTLQNVANNVTFGNKEQYMEFLNDFISQNFLACQDYFDSMAIIPKTGKPACDPNRITLEAKVKAMEHLFAHLKVIWPKMEEKYKAKSWFPKLKEAVDALIEKEKAQVELERTSTDIKK